MHSHNEKRKGHPDIQVLPPQAGTGKDKVIGDVHGGLTTFKLWLETIQPGDRGLCVGDLVDRGEDNLGVIKAIIEHNSNPDNGRVLVIRGNHEEITLNAIHQYENYARCYLQGNATAAKAALNNPTLENALANGGQWLKDIFLDELHQGKININPETGSINYESGSDILVVKEYMSALPYIIHVEGNRPFALVHADMPMNDTQLQEAIRNGEGLTDDQKNYAVWARAATEESTAHDIVYLDFGRTENSMPVVVGHNIVGGPGAPMFRDDTNTFDLDVCAWHNDYFLSLNMTDCTMEWVCQPDAIPDAYYENEAALLNEGLYTQSTLYEYIELIDSLNITTLRDLEDILRPLEEAGLENAKCVQIAKNYSLVTDKVVMRELLNIDHFEKLVNVYLSPDHILTDGTLLAEQVIKTQNVDCLNFLIDRNFDPYRTRHDGTRHFIDMANNTENTTIVNAVLQHCLTCAIENKDQAEIDYAVRNGADVNKRHNGDGITPAEFAQLKGVMLPTTKAKHSPPTPTARSRRSPSLSARSSVPSLTRTQSTMFSKPNVAQPTKKPATNPPARPSTDSPSEPPKNRGKH